MPALDFLLEDGKGGFRRFELWLEPTQTELSPEQQRQIQQLPLHYRAWIRRNVALILEERFFEREAGILPWQAVEAFSERRYGSELEVEGEVELLLPQVNHQAIFQEADSEEASQLNAQEFAQFWRDVKAGNVQRDRLLAAYQEEWIFPLHPQEKKQLYGPSQARTGRRRPRGGLRRYSHRP